MKLKEAVRQYIEAKKALLDCKQEHAKQLCMNIIFIEIVSFIMSKQKLGFNFKKFIRDNSNAN